MFTQHLIQAQMKENIKAPRHWPLCGNSQWPVDSPHKMAVTWKMFPFDDVIMWFSTKTQLCHSDQCDRDVLLSLSCSLAEQGSNETNSCVYVYVSLADNAENVSIWWRHHVWLVIFQASLSNGICLLSTQGALWFRRSWSRESSLSSCKQYLNSSPLNKTAAISQTTF